jgi:pyrroloquinoline quinone biosynthesis protein B
VTLSGCGLAFAGDASYLYVLGIAQDAGYPQAGCYQPHCLRGWNDPALRRTASAVAVIDGASNRKFLFDATPDIGEQLYRLHRTAPDGVFQLAGVFLTHAHIGHYTGLMQFGHEVIGARGVPVYAMPRMQAFLSDNGPWDQLVRYENITLMPLADGEEVVLSQAVRVTPFLVPHRDEYSETVGFRIDGPNRSAIYLPDIDKWQRWETDIRDVVRSVDYALLDATFFADGELPGRDMSNIPHPFVTESMALFDELAPDEKERVIFIHMNHTNPLLVDGSEEQSVVREKGFRVAFEGLRLEL